MRSLQKPEKLRRNILESIRSKEPLHIEFHVYGLVPRNGYLFAILIDLIMSAITCGEARQALVFQAGQIQIRIQGFGESNLIIFKRNTPQLAAAGIKGIRIQLRNGSACMIQLYAAAGTCPACLQRGPPPQRLTKSSIYADFHLAMGDAHDQQIWL